MLTANYTSPKAERVSSTWETLAIVSNITSSSRPEACLQNSLQNSNGECEVWYEKTGLGVLQMVVLNRVRDSCSLPDQVSHGVHDRIVVDTNSVNDKPRLEAILL